MCEYTINVSCLYCYIYKQYCMISIPNYYILYNVRNKLPNILISGSKEIRF